MISIFLTSIHPELWPDFVNRLKKTTVHPFEVVISGPLSCANLPPEIVYVASDAEPVAALELAFKTCRYDYVVQATDDVTYDPGALDKMLAAVQAEPKVIASCKYNIGGRDEPTAHTTSIFAGPNSDQPKAPICPMLKRADWLGQDPVFICQYGDLDLYFRLFTKGWKIVLVDAAVSETPQPDTGRLWASRGYHDLATCRKLWVADGKYKPSAR